MCHGARMSNFKKWMAGAIVLIGFHGVSLAQDAAPAAAPVVKEEEWPKVQAEVAALKAKINQSEETIKKLNEDRLKTRDEEARAEIQKNIKTEYQNLKQIVKDYEERRNYFMYRFPEKGRTAAREYQRIELKSLDEIENQHSLEAKVSKAVKTMRGQFKSEALKKNQQKKDQKNSDLSAPIILSK